MERGRHHNHSFFLFSFPRSRSLLAATLTSRRDDAARAAATAERLARLAPEAGDASPPPGAAAALAALAGVAGDADEPRVRRCWWVPNAGWPDAGATQASLEALGDALAAGTGAAAARACLASGWLEAEAAARPTDAALLAPLFALATGGDAPVARSALRALRAAWAAPHPAWAPPDSALLSALAAAGVRSRADEPHVALTDAAADGGALAALPALRALLAALALAAAAPRAAPRDAPALVAAFGVVQSLGRDPAGRLAGAPAASAAAALLAALPDRSFPASLPHLAAAAARTGAGPASDLESARALPRGGARADALRAAAGLRVAADVAGWALEDAELSFPEAAVLNAPWFGRGSAAAAAALVRPRAGATLAPATRARLLLEAVDEALWPAAACGALSAAAGAAWLAFVRGAADAAARAGASGLDRPGAQLQLAAEAMAQRYAAALEARG